MSLSIRIFLTTLLIIPFALSAQSFEWAHRMGNPSKDLGQCLTSDADGNVYSTGYFNGTVDFDPGPGTANLSGIFDDVFITKFDSSGNFIWAKEIAGPDRNRGYGISVDDSGSVFVVGYFNDSADFDPGPGTFWMTAPNANDQAFVCKLDSMGDFLWAIQFGANGTDNSFAIDNDAAGNAYMVVRFEVTVDIDPGPGTLNLTAEGTADVAILKLDPNGNLLMHQVLGGPGQNMARDIKLDASGNIYTVGIMTDTLDLDPGPGISQIPSSGAHDVFISKLDPSGNYIWGTVIGSSSSDDGYSIAPNADGSVYVSGHFRDSMDFDPGPGNFTLVPEGLFDAYAVKYDASGNFLWVKTWGGSGGDYGRAIASDNFGNAYVAGSFVDTMDIDPGVGVQEVISAGGQDLFYVKLTGSGDMEWAFAMGNSGEDAVMDLKIGPSSEVLSTGFFEGSFDFDPGTGVTNLSASGGNEDIFIHKMSQCLPPTLTLSPESCDSYTSPSGTYVWDTSGTYTDTLPSSGGCGDTLVTVFLTITEIDTTVTTSLPMLSATDSAGPWQWVRCDSGLSPVAGATSQDFTPTVDGEYAVVITRGGCADTSGCYIVMLTGQSSPLAAEYVHLFPNPSEDLVTLATTLPVGTRFEIRDLQGQLMFSKTIQSRETQLNLSGLSKGMYFVRVGETVLRLVRN